jgi:hypothetical protein
MTGYADGSVLRVSHLRNDIVPHAKAAYCELL